jgi:hypothetical protein
MVNLETSLDVFGIVVILSRTQAAFKAYRVVVLGRVPYNSRVQHATHPAQKAEGRKQRVESRRHKADMSLPAFCILPFGL